MRVILRALAVLMVAGILRTDAATLFPYLDPVRVAAADQLARGPADAKTKAALTRTLRLTDAPGKPTLAKDLRLLSILGPALMKSSAAGSFHEPLNSAVDHYLAHLMAAADQSAARLSTTPPSQQQTAAQARLQSLNTLLAAINETTDVAKACRLLGRAGPKLKSTDKLIAKAMNPTASGQSTAGGGSETSDSGLTWMVVSTSGAGSSDAAYSSGLRVVVFGGNDGWNYMIRW
jgi:hypothetical protein